MHFNILSPPLLTYLAYSTMPDSLEAAKHLSRISTLPLLNTSQGKTPTPSSNLSDILTLPTPLPYGFSVPNTQIYLRLGFGLPRHRLDPLSLGGLIAFIQHEIIEGINRDGEDAFPGLNIVEDEQKFGWTLGYGFHFEMHNLKGSGKYIKWEQVKNVVEGLRLYLMVGERYYATMFNFWDGVRWGRMPLGYGGFVIDVVRKVEMTE